MSSTRAAYDKVTLSPDVEETWVAVPEGINAKPYPIWKETPAGDVLLPNAKNIPASKKYKGDGRMSFTPREYQHEPIQACVDTLLKNKGLLLRAPCGTGKTVMALGICQRMKYERVVILVDQRDIADQWQERIQEFEPGSTCEVYHSGRTPIKEMFDSPAKYKVVVAQSLMRQEWSDKPYAADMLICDEAHIFSAPRFCKAIYNIDYHHSMALTATDDRKDGLTWVFMMFLAAETIDVKATTMQAKVVSPVMNVSLRWTDYHAAFCAKIKKMTWRANCRKCDYGDKFPVRCGGNLPMTVEGVKWNKDRLMWTSMLSDLVNDEEYIDKFIPVIVKFFKADRQVMVFNQFTAPLKHLHKKVAKLIGGKNCGLYIGATKDKDKELALTSRVTFTTYKMSQKALDVPWKDAIIMTSPVTDIRQTVGRITRIKEGKRQPVVFDPLINNVKVLKYQHKARMKHYKELGFMT